MPIDPLKTIRDFEIAIGGVRHAMSVLAIWPKMSQSAILTIIWFFYFTGFFTCISASFAGAVMIDRDFERLIGVLGQAIPMTVITVKYGLFKAQIKPLKYVLKSMEDDWERPKQKSAKHETAFRCNKIMTSHSRISRIFFNIYTSIVMICWALFVTSPGTRRVSASNHSTVTEFPMSSWYPWSSNLSPFFEIIYVFEIVIGTAMVIAHTSIDGLLVAIIFHLCGQFEILRCSIEEFGTNDRIIEIMYADLKCIVDRHVSVIDTAHELEKSFNQILLGQLLGGTFSICLAGFSFLQAMESNNPSGLIRFALLLTMALQQMFIYSLAGNYLTSQGTAIRMAAYEANWYELPPSVSKLFSLIMIRAAEPITITAGKFFPMSLSSFTGLLRSAASYLSVMRAMNTDKLN